LSLPVLLFTIFNNHDWPPSDSAVPHLAGSRLDPSDALKEEAFAGTIVRYPLFAEGLVVTEFALRSLCFSFAGLSILAS